ncbi:MAG: transketolase C-terminal domain-containing protein [Candidatus Micrarchaeia archaeon]
MAIRTMNYSAAIAEVASYCKVDVVASYPITPSTPITHELNKLYVNGGFPKFITVEAEFSAISSLLGASAAGARTFSATCGQGLMLMHEALFSTSGMRLPVVMAVANRAISSPLNIWADEQDAMCQRDSGWIQLYCKNGQEAVDTTIQAFKIAEKMMIPAMVCLDGFYLTHSVGQIDLPDKDKVAAFLPPYKNPFVLDPQNPLTVGAYAVPADYQDFREDLCADLESSAKTIEEVGKEFGKVFGREYGLVEYHNCKDADRVIITLGSVYNTIEMVADALRAKGEKVGVAHLRSFRPFPASDLRANLGGKHVLVVERDVSPGAVPPVYAEVSEALGGTGSTVSVAAGLLGGREAKRQAFEALFERMKQGKVKAWLCSKEKKL